jgi:photosystem II stability/assembly factor-like uncharacterized protein
MHFSFCWVVWLASPVVFAQSWLVQPSGTTASLRGVSAVSAVVGWASGSGGTYLRTIDGGSTWHAAAVPGAEELDFRGVRALDARAAWLMSSGPGEKSRVYKTTDGGGHWTLLFSNPDAAGFFDAIAFWDARHGILLGDPVDGRFTIFTTADGGHSWQRQVAPAALANEGAFAASNSCLAVAGRREVWFATGGSSAARVIHSADRGRSWEMAATPLRHDGAAAGIFSLAFADTLHGVAVGGDYSKPGETAGNVAVTADGGRTWTTPSGVPGGYRSAIAFLAKQKLWLAVGTSGSDISRDGRNWTKFDGGAYNALGVSPDGMAWAVGPGGRIGLFAIRNQEEPAERK